MASLLSLSLSLYIYIHTCPSNNAYPESNQTNSWYWYLFLYVLSSHLRIVIPKGLFSAFFEISHTFSHSGYMTCPSQSSILNHLDCIRWTVQTMSLLLFLLSPLLGPNICLRIPFSNTLSLRYSLNVKDHASRPYSTIGHIYINVCMCMGN